MCVIAEGVFLGKNTSATTKLERSFYNKIITDHAEHLQKFTKALLLYDLIFEGTHTILCDIVLTTKIAFYELHSYFLPLSRVVDR